VHNFDDLTGTAIGLYCWHSGASGLTIATNANMQMTAYPDVDLRPGP
jgi:hypothetical protein